MSYYEFIYLPQTGSMDVSGYYVTPPTTKRDRAKAKRGSSPQITITKTQKSRLPAKFRDFSRYQEEQLKLGRTKKQIDQDLEKEIRKLLKQNTQIHIQQGLTQQGLDPEYDLDELEDLYRE